MGWAKIQIVKELSLVHKFAEFIYQISLAISNKIKTGTVPDREVVNKKLAVELGLTNGEITFFNNVLDTLANKSKSEIFKLVVSSVLQMMRDEKNGKGIFSINNHQELIDDLRGVALSEDHAPRTRLGQIILNLFENIPKADSIHMRQMFRQLTLVNIEIEKKEGFEKTLAVYDMFSSLQLYLQSTVTTPIKYDDQNHNLNAVILNASKNNAISGQTRIAARTRHEKDRDKEKPLVDKIIEMWEAECAKNPNRKLKQTDAASTIYKAINMNEPLRALYKTIRDKDEIDYEKIKSVISKQVASEKQTKK